MSAIDKFAATLDTLRQSSEVIEPTSVGASLEVWQREQASRLVQQLAEYEIFLPESDPLITGFTNLIATNCLDEMAEPEADNETFI